MAERRMFSKTIVDSDAFLDMPLSTQALYFHLGMRADDDGFINNPKKIQRMVGAGDDDLKLLIAKRFILCFDSGVVVIKHWKMHNYIQKDRYKPTVYTEEKAMLQLQKNGAYTECIQSVSSPDTQVSIGKDSIELGKDSIELGQQQYNAEEVDDFVKPSLEEVKLFAEAIAYQKGVECIDVYKWYDYYEKNKWYCHTRNGVVKMSDWKKSVQFWFDNVKKREEQKKEIAAEEFRQKLKEQGIELYSSNKIEM